MLGDIFSITPLSSRVCIKKSNLLQIDMQSTVVYDASQGYDEDTWDDSALIKAYDRAKESSRCSKFLSLSFCFLSKLEKNTMIFKTYFLIPLLVGSSKE